MEDPPVSVILIVRNGERFLTQAVDSVLAQTYRPIEFIVVDGDSTDNTAAIVQSYPSIDYYLQSGLGNYAAYNEGYSFAKHDLIAWMSHDDLWEPEKLELQVKALIEHPEWLYVVTYIRHFLEPGFNMPPGFRPELLDSSRAAYTMENFLGRRAVFDQVGLYDERYRETSDIDWYARAHDMQIKHGMLPQTLVHRRVHDQNLTYIPTITTNQPLLRVLHRSVQRKRRK